MAESEVGKGKFCVISPTVDAHRIKRSWKDTLDEGIKHGTKLLQRQHDQGNKSCRRLLVVQVVKVIEVPPSVNVSVRDPEADDLAVETEED